ncbi:putative repeat protein (TIGR03843 family) [Propionibacteriaceae bacterium ES.041]|uniref:Phosphatidylinositol kinase n=1 Tax=Enemella evansiae TaxID=2016499 RepID=A0A255G112_9ACTN|nr:SCO1664 family protein [Enemella evansiae]PFG66813.1 putative repeat protein (TIGR03843 family) [Propionibacteriaceae bacterium ES.041]OYO02848.1 phosphatidylinositol kinase [Enemella evansiae]OYO09627.1 phosphatidylinositol kinase [Enemella evansiae]OYO15139.1 phosphatidylinositol kinase [Enemella evansiae]OYO20210.1 phosphatidylinositol kinase [Enemella evansiae]
MATVDRSSEAGFADRLAGAELTVTGRLVQASNATFLCELTPAGGEAELCVYKPVRGERPLWDFPDGTLAQRELAAYKISAAAGFDLVPETVVIEGPLGAGSLQCWIEQPDQLADLVDLVPEDEVPEGWFEVVEGVDPHDRPVVVVHADDPALRRMALFDAIINNADRKGAHILRTPGEVWGVDHGVSFNTEPKLRTVLWGWAGEELTAAERELVTAALDASGELEGLLTDDEVAAFELRCEELLSEGHFPLPHGGWPSIPWPPV